MNKRFECPACGAGVKPKDRQCFRCGSDLDHGVEIEPLPSDGEKAQLTDLEVCAGIESLRLKAR